MTVAVACSHCVNIVTCYNYQYSAGRFSTSSDIMLFYHNFYVSIGGARGWIFWKFIGCDAWVRNGLGLYVGSGDE